MNTTLAAASNLQALAGSGFNTNTRLGGLVLAIIIGVVCGAIAGRKGRRPALWGILGFFFTIITLIVILIVPSKRPAGY
ncbi:MAG TPA: hypothetical protein VLR26_07755 [Frankiaceae bacterium]|nr:hypothetical protein [Frankiaceae bacterium]